MVSARHEARKEQGSRVARLERGRETPGRYAWFCICGVIQLEPECSEITWRQKQRPQLLLLDDIRHTVHSATAMTD